MNKKLKNWEEFEEYLVTTRYSVRNLEDGTPIEKNWNDITTRIEKALRANPGILDLQTLDKIIDAIKNRYIIPASPFLMTFGNPYTQRKGYFSCYPLGYVGDSMKEIYEMCNLMMQIYIRGGGVGIDISKLRPKNSPVDQKQGISSGPVGFLQLFDSVTATTNQGGRRRGALLVQMHWKHPDIIKFIKAKALVPYLSKVIYQFPEEDRIDVPLQNMNISVVVDDEFWEKGQELFDLIAENAWKSGDPGLLFLNNMRKFSPFNPKEYGDEHDPAFSNPCGEYLAPAFTACNLITINIAKIAKESLINEKEFDFERFYKTVAYYAQLASFLGSYLVELDEGYPTEVIRKKTQETRPVGVGMTGFHTALLLAYDGYIIYGKDEKAVEFAENTQAALTIGTLTASSKLTKQTKKSYKWNPEYLWLHLEELKEVVEKRNLPLKNEIESIVDTASEFNGFYNAITTSQPPTGSVSQFARVAGDTGIEPMYAIELQRRVRDFYTNEWKTVTITTEYLIEKLENKDFRKRVEKQLAYALNPEDQLVMLEAFQKFIHTGVSKTINVPQNTTIEQIKELIIRSKNARLKGFTVFREGCRVDTVYISPKEKESKSAQSETIQETELAPTREAFVYEVKGTVNAYVTTTFDEEKRVREVFISVGKAGTTLNGMFQAFGRVISVTLREHPELVYRIINTLEGIETGEFYKCDGITGKSLPDIIAKIIKDALERAKAKNENPSIGSKPLAEASDREGDLCPVCGKLSVFKNGSCKTCRECGFTTC